MNNPGVLYHYTSAVGLIGIIEDRVLWATDAEFLNDAQELRFGRSELREALLAQADELSPPGTDRGGPDDTRATVMRSAADHLEPGGLFVQKQAHSAYVVCFCEEGDLLSQWRAYAVSGGYAIGFHTSHLGEMRPLYVGLPIREGIGSRALKKLKRLSLPVQWGPSLPVQLVRVMYGPPAVEVAIAKVLRDVAPRPTGHPAVTGFFQAQSVVLPALAEIKHEAFSEEREWRLIVVGSIGQEAVSFRSGTLGGDSLREARLPGERDR